MHEAPPSPTARLAAAIDDDKPPAPREAEALAREVGQALTTHTTSTKETDR